MDDYRQARSLSDVVEFHQMTFNLLGRAEPERLVTGVVSANYFDVLGVEAREGLDGGVMMGRRDHTRRRS